MSDPGLMDEVSATQENAGASPGAILRRCREFHALTLEEASEATKIGVSYLKALEGDQIKEFANRAYLMGFLRIYANYLGLNSDDLARMYDKLSGIQNDRPASVGADISTSREPRRRVMLLKKMLLPAILLAAILITATFFKRPPAPPAPPLQQVATSVSPPQNSAIQIVQSSVRVKKIDPVVQVPKPEAGSAVSSDSEPGATPPKLPPETPEAFILKIKVTQGGTLTATVDGAAAQQYELAVGDIIEWKAEKIVALELSNAGGVDVELNGKPFKPLGSLGKPVYVELDADGVVQ